MAAPTITSFSPTTGTTGTLITISGTNLTGATLVKFGGVSVAHYSIITGGLYIVAVVGSGATGSLTITTPDGTATHAGFTFISPSCACEDLSPSCIPQPLIPVCDDPEYCEDVFIDKCIIHKGDDLVNIGAVDGERLNSILLKIDTILGTLMS